MMSTNPFFVHGIDKLCTICHLILKDADSTHSIFSTVEELESPMNVLQVLQSFSNFTSYNVPEMVCTSCYDKAIEAYKFIQMCNKADKNMQHYLKDVEAKTIKYETDVDVKVEEISIAYSRIITDERELIEETENEKIGKFDEVGMVFSGTQIKIEDRILKDGLAPEEIKTIKDETDVDVTFEKIFIAPARFIIDGREFVEEMENEKISKFDTSNNEESTISHTEIVSDNFEVEKIDAEMHDERMGLVKCKDCHLVFSDKKELGDHRTEAKHTKEKLLFSESCKASFGRKENLRSHDQRFNAQRTCISENLRLNQDRHQPVIGHETDVVWPECQEMLSIKFESDLVHSGESHIEVKVHKCEQCDRRFTRAADLRRHMDRHNGVKAHKCEQCERRFTRAENLRRHIDDIHNDVKAHKCEQCDRRFTQPSDLRRHMDMRHGLKAHKCEQCERRFTHASDLRRHMDIHNEVKAHKCVQCHRRFTQAADLRRHMDIHTGVKAYKCEQCDRRFTQAAHLRSHMDVHNGVKPHKCEQCGRRFTQASHLRSHMDIHNGVKPHKCEQCDRRFTQAGTLRRHMIIHNRKFS